RDRPADFQGVGEPQAELVAYLDRGQRLRGVEEVLVRGVVAVPPQQVEVVADVGDDGAGLGKRAQPIDLAVAFKAYPEAGDQLFGEHLTELPGLDQGPVRVGVDGGLGESSVQRE